MPENAAKLPPLSGFILKVIAMITMTFDHVGYFLESYPMGSKEASIGHVFRIIGRIAFPLYMFLLAEGMNHTRHPWKYMFRMLGVYATISIGETIFLYGLGGKVGSLIFSPDSLSPEAFTDLTYCALTLACLRQKGGKKLFAIFPLIYIGLSFGCTVYDNFHPSNIILWFPRFLRCDYNLLGLALSLAFFYAPSIVGLAYKKPLQDFGISKEAFYQTSMGRKAINTISCVLLFTVVIIFWGISYITEGRQVSPVYDMSMQTYCLLSALPILFYSGKRGYDSKVWRIASYLYYPVHLAVIALIFTLN